MAMKPIAMKKKAAIMRGGDMTKKKGAMMRGGGMMKKAGMKRGGMTKKKK